MKVTLIYPEHTDTFWSMKYALKFVSKKATHPPLGLLTIAAMLPESWEVKVIDMNTGEFRINDIAEADLVFISAMVIQRKSVEGIIALCKDNNIRIAAGGPLFTTEAEEFDMIDYLILNEAEITLPVFLEDLKKGTPRHVYSSDEFADLGKTPVPAWGLINLDKYVSMSLQYSRGCPFNCEFCEITALFGHKFRTKNSDQVIDELECLYHLGWRGDIFFADDNFIGNRSNLKKEILPAVISWMKIHKYPFFFNTQASINIADDDSLLELMAEAGFNSVFIGIETPNEKSLAECSKYQNRNRDLIDSVKKIQNSGIKVTAGFIVGFDNDGSGIFSDQIDFIKKSGIICAMVGLLNAPRGSSLYMRLLKDKRILNDFKGDNVDYSINFIPKMGYKKLINGYHKIISEIYSAKPYYERVIDFLKEYKPIRLKTSFLKNAVIRFHSGYLGAFFKTLWVLGIKDSNRLHFWKLFLWSVIKRPRLLPLAILYSIYGFHFRNVFDVDK